MHQTSRLTDKRNLWIALGLLPLGIAVVVWLGKKEAPTNGSHYTNATIESHTNRAHSGEFITLSRMTNQDARNVSSDAGSVSTGISSHPSQLAGTNATHTDAVAQYYQNVADTTARGAQLTPGTKLEFDHAEVNESSIRYVYVKVFDQPSLESPNTVIVIFDRKTQQANILLQE